MLVTLLGIVRLRLLPLGPLNEAAVWLLSNKTPIHAAIDGIVCIHHYRCKAGALIERTVRDVSDGAWDGDVGKAGAEKAPNAGDRQAIDPAGMVHDVSGPCIG